MQPLTDLVKGLEILEPFLTRLGFSFDNYENGNGSGGQYTNATFKSEPKKFVIGYRYSVTELYYQFKDFKVGPEFYLDHLGFADKKLFPGFQSDDKLLAFRNILHDFDFLVDDFFQGSCDQLIEAAKMQAQFVKELNAKAIEENKNHADLIKIESARHQFKERNFKGTLDIYLTVENKALLNDFDKKTIEYCAGHT